MWFYLHHSPHKDPDSSSEQNVFTWSPSGTAVDPRMPQQAHRYHYLVMMCLWKGHDCHRNNSLFLFLIPAPARHLGLLLFFAGFSCSSKKKTLMLTSYSWLRCLIIKKKCFPEGEASLKTLNMDAVEGKWFFPPLGVQVDHFNPKWLTRHLIHTELTEQSNFREKLCEWMWLKSSLFVAQRPLSSCNGSQSPTRNCKMWFFLA